MKKFLLPALICCLLSFTGLHAQSGTGHACVVKVIRIVNDTTLDFEMTNGDIPFKKQEVTLSKSTTTGLSLSSEKLGKGKVTLLKKGRGTITHPHFIVVMGGSPVQVGDTLSLRWDGKANGVVKPKKNNNSSIKP
jgi:hypothetical protein